MVAAPRAGTQRKGGKPGASIRAYGCHVVSGGCGHTYGLADPIEAMVTEAVLAKLDRAGLRAARSSQEGPDDVLGDAIAADEAQLAELADDWADNKITRMEWLRARDRVEVRLADRRRQVRRRPINVLDGLTDLRAEWDALSLDRRRAIIAAVLDRVTLAPATGIRNRFDPDRVGFEWRA